MANDRVIVIRRLRTGSVFRVAAAGIFFSLIPFAMVMGVCGLFGMDTLSWNEKPVHGVTALVASPFVGAFIAAMFTAFGGSGLAFGLWLYSKFKPLRLTVVEDIESDPVV